MRHAGFQTHASPSRTSRSLVVMALTVWCAMVGFRSAEVAAQDATFTGTWQHQGSAAERAHRYQAIDQATEHLSYLIRGKVRERLREVTTPARELTVIDKGDRVTLSMAGRRITLPTDGSPKRVSGKRGSGTILAYRKNGQLIVTVRGKSGTRTAVHRLSDGGRRLILDVYMNSAKLRQPLRYRVTYIRR